MDSFCGLPANTEGRTHHKFPQKLFRVTTNRATLPITRIGDKFTFSFHTQL